MNIHEPAKSYILKNHKNKIVMHEVLPNNFHPFIHLDGVYLLVNDYTKELQNRIDNLEEKLCKCEKQVELTTKYNRPF